MLVQVRIKCGCAACCTLCFKCGDGLMCTAFGCYDSKLEVPYRPFKSCSDASLVALRHQSFDHTCRFLSRHDERCTQCIVTPAILLCRSSRWSCLCRQWGLILGVVILAFGLLPSFRSVRLLNIIALCGTNYSCLYFFIYAAKHGIQPGAFTRYPAATPALVTCPKGPN